MIVNERIERLFSEIKQDADTIVELRNQVKEKSYMLGHVLAEANVHKEITDDQYNEYKNTLDNLESAVRVN